MFGKILVRSLTRTQTVTHFKFQQLNVCLGVREQVQLQLQNGIGNENKETHDLT